MRRSIDPSRSAPRAGRDPAAVLDVERRLRPGGATNRLRRGPGRVVVGAENGAGVWSVWIVCARTGTGTAPASRTERRAHDAQALAIYALMLLGVWRLVHKRPIESLVDHWQHGLRMTTMPDAHTPRAALDGEALFRSAEHDVEVDDACEDRRRG